MSDGEESSGEELVQELEQILSPAPATRARRAAASEGESTPELQSPSNPEEEEVPPSLEEEETGAQEEEKDESSVQGSVASSSSAAMSTSQSPEAAAAEAALKSVFDLTTAKTDDEYLKGKVAVPKDKRGAPGSPEYGKNYKYAVDVLPCEKFAAAAYVGPTSREGEAESGTTHYKNIQSMYVSNRDKLKVLKERVIRYDMLDAVMIPAVKDPSGSTMLEKWDFTQRANLIENWTVIPQGLVEQYQIDVNNHSSKDSVSSNWLRDLLEANTEPTLVAKAHEKYDQLIETVDLKCEGGIIYLKILLDEMFCMTTEVVEALQSYLENFAQSGVEGEVGENVYQITRTILVVAGQLKEVNDLPAKAVQWVLQGFSKCSVTEFASPFKLLLQQGEVDRLGKQITITSDCEDTLRQITDYCHKANSAYDSLCLAEKWIKGSIRACWNCDDPNHPLNKCPKEKDQARIEANKKKWEEKTGKKAGGGGTRGDGNYERRQFGDGSRKGRGKQGGGGANSASSGIKLKNGQWMMLCNKDCGNGKCGWNTTHSTKYHGKYQKNPSAFPGALPNTHPIWNKISKPADGSAQPPPLVPSDTSGASTGTNASGLTSASFPGAAVMSGMVGVFETLSKTTSDPDTAKAMEELAKTWKSLK